MFPAKRKRIFMNLFLRIPLASNVAAYFLYSICSSPAFTVSSRSFSVSESTNLELNNKCIIALISWLQHHIVSSESTLPVRSHNITILQFYNQPQNKWYRRQIYYYFQFFLSCISFQNFLEPIQNHDTIIEPEYI